MTDEDVEQARVLVALLVSIAFFGLTPEDRARDDYDQAGPHPHLRGLIKVCDFLQRRANRLSSAALRKVCHAPRPEEYALCALAHSSH
eukprot:5042788-Prymnesium_polylepis.2